jgi:transposase
MKNYKEVVGIDVSKKIDAYCYQAQVHKEFKNDAVGYKSLIKWVLKETKEADVFYCFMNTGYFSLKLALYLHSQKVVYVEESKIELFW